MTLYEQNGKKYEIKIVEGVETIESETKPPKQNRRIWQCILTVGALRKAALRP